MKKINAQDYAAFKAWKKQQQQAADGLDYWTRKGFVVTNAKAGVYKASNGKAYPVTEVKHSQTGQVLALKATRNGQVYVARNF